MVERRAIGVRDEEAVVVGGLRPVERERDLVRALPHWPCLIGPCLTGHASLAGRWRRSGSRGRGGRRHDFIAIQIKDERERSLPNVGIITLEDAETGEQIEINTADRKTRTVFTDLVTGFETELSRTLRRNNVDTITLQTGRDYLPALRSFFKQRERRLGVR